MIKGAGVFFPSVLQSNCLTMFLAHWVFKHIQLGTCFINATFCEISLTLSFQKRLKLHFIELIDMFRLTCTYKIRNFSHKVILMDTNLKTGVMDDEYCFQKYVCCHGCLCQFSFSEMRIHWLPQLSSFTLKQLSTAHISISIQPLVFLLVFFPVESIEWIELQPSFDPLFVFLNRWDPNLKQKSRFFSTFTFLFVRKKDAYLYYGVVIFQSYI